MIKCDFWELESTQKLLWFQFEKCLNTEKLLPCYFYQGWSIDPNDLNPTGLDSAFPDLSNKIGFNRFGSVNRAELIFETMYRTKFEYRKASDLLFLPRVIYISKWFQSNGLGLSISVPL